MTHSAREVTEQFPLPGDRAGELLERLPDGVALYVPVTAPDGRAIDLRLEYLNPAGCRLAGVADLDDVRGASAAVVTPGMRHAALLATYEECRRSGAPLTRELDDLRSGRWFQTQASVDDRGRLLIVFRDVTASREVLDRADQERSRAQQLVAAVPDALLVVDATWRITVANAAAEALLGRRTDGLTGRVLWAALPELTGSPAERVCRRAASDHEAGEAELARPDGVLVLHARPVVDGVGIALRRIDVPATTTLERRRHAAVASLASAVAHDFNNLLTVITGHAQLLRQGADPSLHPSLDAIGTASERASELSRQLLSLTRHREPAPAATTDLAKAVREMEGLLRRLMPTGIRLDAGASDDDLSVLADPTRVHRLLVDLVALGVTHRSGGVLTLHAGRDGAGAIVELDGVADVPAAELAELVDAARLGGAELDRVASDGFLRLRFAPAAVHPAGEPSGAVPTVLVAEDHEQVRDLMVAALKAAGYRVLAAADADEALAVAATEPGHIDLLLSDVVMPGRSGFELAAALTATRPGTPALLMSGYAETTVLPERDEHGVEVEFLGKPFAPAQLVAAVERLVGGRTRRRPPP